MLQDFRYAVRVLASRPGFTLVAALSLALGIGANAAIFSVVDTFWFRPPAVLDAGRIVRVVSTTSQEREGLWFSYPEYLEFARNVPALRDVVAVGGRGISFVSSDEKQLLLMNLVSPDFFTALGVEPAAGRLFTPRDGTSGGLLVVLGNNFWHRQFGGDPAIVGKQIRLQRAHEVLATVIGVLPASFRDTETGGGDRDVWFSLPAWRQLGDSSDLENRNFRWFRVLARLAPHASVASANAQVQALGARMAADWPESNRGRRASVISDLHFRLEQAGQNGVVLLAVVLLVVLISSVNVANLLLARAGARGQEMAVRLALGARRGRLVRQLMAENILLGLAGLLLGMAVGEALIAVLPALIVQPPELHVTFDFRFDQRVLAFSLIVSAATVFLFGLAPAWRCARPNLVPALKGEAAFTRAASRRWTLRHYLVAAQVAVSMTLLTAAGVLVQSFANTRISDLGFSRKPLLLVWLSSDGAKPSLYRELMSRFRALPGVRSVAAAIRAPLSLSGNGMTQRVTFPGRPEFANAPPFEILYNAVTANFLKTMGTDIIRGRDFDEHDETAVLINETMARRFWPDQDPIGKTIAVEGRSRIVVGVVRNTPVNDLSERPQPYLYLPYWANFSTEVTFLIETTGDAAAPAPAARRALKEVDSRLDPLGITTEGELVRFSALLYQVTAELAGALGLLGLVLTAVGLYGLVSYGVSQRTRELGIRMALGAERGDTLRLVFREAALLGAVGLAAGLPVALAATRLLSALLYAIGPWDVRAFAGAALLLLGVLFAAAFAPARRATTVDPAAALRVG